VLYCFNFSVSGIVFCSEEEPWKLLHSRRRTGTISTVSAGCQQLVVGKYVHVICCDFFITSNLKTQGNWNNWTNYWCLTFKGLMIILILFSQLCCSFPSVVFLSGFSTNFICICDFTRVFHLCYLCQPHHSNIGVH